VAFQAAQTLLPVRVSPFLISRKLRRTQKPHRQEFLC
jgi:hypothetical protein